MAKGIRIKTGMKGLDTLIDGGLPPDTVLLLSGSAGTGKTILSLQFLFEGFKNGEKGIFLTFEENEAKIRDQAARFGWDFGKYEKEGIAKLLSVPDVGIVTILETVKSHIEEFHPKRMVVDSITFMSLSAYSAKRLIELEKTNVAEIYEHMGEHTVSPEYEGLVVRKLLVDFVKIMQNKSITTILTSEIPRESVWLSRDTFSEYACDGVVLLKATSIGTEMHRTLEVVKMRNTKMKGGVYSFDFSKTGVEVAVQ